MLMKLFSLFLLISVAQAETWTPPGTINKEVVQIRFEVDSTWHLIHGAVPDVSGKIWLKNIRDPSSIRAELLAAVAAFDTDNSSRDKEMRHVMDADQFPQVLMKIDGFKGEPCVPIKVEKSGRCSGLLDAEIKIRDVSTKMSLPFRVTPEGDVYKVEGDFALKWEDFGVEDPSILVAKLDDTVRIYFKVLMNRVS